MQTYTKKSTIFGRRQPICCGRGRRRPNLVDVDHQSRLHSYIRASTFLMHYSTATGKPFNMNCDKCLKNPTLNCRHGDGSNCTKDCELFWMNQVRCYHKVIRCGICHSFWESEMPRCIHPVSEMLDHLKEKETTVW
jgi:hypothetical protein